METIMTICALGTFGSATIGLLLLAIGFLSGWGWAYRAASACIPLFVLFLFWHALLSECM